MILRPLAQNDIAVCHPKRSEGSFSDLQSVIFNLKKEELR